MASVVCVSVKIYVSSISLYKLDSDKLTTPFESAHQFTQVCTVSDFKIVSGCHFNSCSKSQFCSDCQTNSYLTLFRAVFSLPDTLCPCCTLICAYYNRGQIRYSSLGDWSPSLTTALEFECVCFLSSRHHSKFSLTHAQQVCFTHVQYKEDHMLHHVVALNLVVKTQA